MKFIHTTATAVQKIKSAAKTIATQSDISHTKALEQAANQAGYESWFHVQRCRKEHDWTITGPQLAPIKDQVASGSTFPSTLAHAAVKMHVTKGRAFHDVSIDGYRFKGQVLSTGDIAIINVRRSGSLWIDESYVSIGAASIRRCDPLKNTTGSEWWICKYSSDEPRLDLGGMTEGARNALAYEFGLPLIPINFAHHGNTDPQLPWSPAAYSNEVDLFYKSPAFVSLAKWAKLHPRIAKSSSDNCNHLRGWLSVASEHGGHHFEAIEHQK